MKVYLKTILDYLFYVLTSFFFIVVFILLITSDNKFLKWSIFDYANIKSEEYDWTVYPIEYVPNPFLLTYDQRKQDYAKIDSKDFIKTLVSQNLVDKYETRKINQQEVMLCTLWI